MQTPAERQLITTIVNELNKRTEPAQLLNIGAGSSTIIEREIATQTPLFVCDRVDVEDHHVIQPNVRNEYVAMVEAMHQVPSETYDIAFANYVLEHVSETEDAAREIHRVLKCGGLFIATAPNPRAPEFLISRITPRAFHQFMRGSGEGSEAFSTHYDYRSFRALNRMFEKTGFEIILCSRFAFTYGYLHSFPILSSISKTYDAILNALHLRALMGHACIVYKKISLTCMNPNARQ